MYCTYSKLGVLNLIFLHTISGAFCILAVDHLDESMALVDVDNTGLNGTKLAEERSQGSVSKGDTSDEEGTTVDLDVTLGQASIEGDALGSWWRKVGVTGLR